MQCRALLTLCLLVGCRPSPSSSPVVTLVAPPASAPQHAPSRDLSAAWSAAVTAKNASAVEGMLALPFTLYLDDGYSDPFHAAGCAPVRVIRTITTAAERSRVASCIATTVSLATVSSTADPIGPATADHVLTIVPPDVHAEVSARSTSHVFSRIPSIMSGDYDVTLAVPTHGAAKADLVVLWTVHG